VSAIRGTPTGIAATVPVDLARLLDPATLRGVRGCSSSTPYLPCVVEPNSRASLAAEGLTVSVAGHLGICDKTPPSGRPRRPTLQSMNRPACFVGATATARRWCVPTLRCTAVAGGGVRKVRCCTSFATVSPARNVLGVRAVGFGGCRFARWRFGALLAARWPPRARSAVVCATGLLQRPVLIAFFHRPAFDAADHRTAMWTLRRRRPLRPPGVEGDFRWDPSLDQRGLGTGLLARPEHRRLLVPAALPMCHVSAARVCGMSTAWPRRSFAHRFPSPGRWRGWLSVHSIRRTGLDARPEPGRRRPQRRHRPVAAVFRWRRNMMP